LHLQLHHSEVLRKVIGALGHPRPSNATRFLSRESQDNNNVTDVRCAQTRESVFLSQPRRMGEAEFRDEGKKLASNVGNWFDVGSKEYALKLKKFAAIEGREVYITSNWIPKGDKWQYQSLVLFR
jgi:hypothetical protein